MGLFVSGVVIAVMSICWTFHANGGQKKEQANNFINNPEILGLALWFIWVVVT
jgi:hypothetical protein